MEKNPVKLKYQIRIALATVVIGVCAGLGAAFLSWLIHVIEHFAFGHIESQTELLTEGTSWLRRILALTLGGLVIGYLWARLQIKGVPVVGINGMIKGDKASAKSNISHALLQIFAVGVGAPIGREVAPRELGALFATRVTRFFGIDPDTKKILIACGAAAGLAGVYHVPFAGAMFAIEILIGMISLPIALMALTTSLVATFVARIAVNPETFYQVPQIGPGVEHILWAIVIGACVGIPAKFFRWQVKKVEATRLNKNSLYWSISLSFFLTGLVAIFLPEILGNGRSTAQVAFWVIPFFSILAILIAKWVMVLVTLKAGAYGGVLTPGLALGAALGLTVGIVINALFPSMDLTVAAVTGAGAFLAVSMNAPATAYLLTLGFTGQSFDAYMPLLAAVVTAFAVSSLYNPDENNTAKLIAKAKVLYVSLVAKKQQTQDSSTAVDSISVKQDSVSVKQESVTAEQETATLESIATAEQSATPEQKVKLGEPVVQANAKSIQDEEQPVKREEQPVKTEERSVKTEE